MRDLVMWGGTAALALALAACGDDTGGAGGSGAGGDDTPTTSAGTTGAGTTSAGSTTSGSTTSGSTTSGSTGSGEGGSGDGGAGAGGGDGGAGGGETANVVEVPCDGADVAADIGTSGLNFEPEQLTIAAGDTIRFTPTGAHDMDSDTDEFATPTSAVACLRFDVAGEYPYHCSVHGQSMSGTVIVE